ncbi:MAG: hypothetical protein ACYTE8_03695 [Planctomycetota bacterium]|jgi:hypothetical protein
MAEKDHGLHKDIASIFQDMPAQKEEQQGSSADNKSEQNSDFLTNLLTPSHLVSETETTGQLENETEQQDGQQQNQITEEQTEQSVEDADTIHQTQEIDGNENTVPVPEQETQIVSETTIHEQPVDNDKASVPEDIQPKVIVPQAASKLDGIRKSVKNLLEKLLAPRPGVDSKRQKLMIVLIPTLLVILLVVLTQVFKSPAKNINTAVDTVASDVITTSGEITWQMPEPYPENLRNPMKAGTVSTAIVVAGDIDVRGILFSQDNPSALIGEDIVHEGDEVFGATVIKITKDNVQFERDGETWTQSVQR